ncbi:hypothetical protein QTP70_022951 [Hemibagrus guttatus]|uniref:protein-tyrosine-phosphatase n=1 Tax=Hemibagrus guttatus TaxID=175788 RepID=A0AAE0Q830_9TELE|nr:hypothetical protein QTP70_022951 [Hemibagrus guttatus]
MHIVSNLTAGTEYNFTLYTVFGESRSTGLNFTDVTTPKNVASLSVKNRNETTLILEWNKVNNNSIYSYTLCYNDQNVSISKLDRGSTVTYTVPDLIAGMEYNFILYTVFQGVQSTGYIFTTVTTPKNVATLSVKSRNETTLILEWNKVNNNSIYNYTLCYNDQNISISKLDGGSTVKCTVPGLIAGTEYIFILYTVFQGVQSTGYIFTTVTTPIQVANISVKNRNETELILEWNKVNNNNIYNYTLSYNDQNISISKLEEGSTVTYIVPDLTAGTEYIFILYTVFNGVRSTGYNFTTETTPLSITNIYVKNCNETSLILEWNKVDNNNIYNYRLSYNSKNVSISGSKEGSVMTYIVTDLTPGTKYTFTLYTVFKEVESRGYIITRHTRVIAGVVTSLLLVILILCIGIFIWHHKTKISSLFKSSNETKLSSNTYKPILLKKFPMHFSSMSCDENRGFSAEYEDLSKVGADQSCRVATLPENMGKNRFTNVLAYDSSRVKLVANPGSDSDYINANYIHGYGKKKKQYIAAQGPLPSTVNDFWKMVWEQKSSAIVMLTNCTEGGKNKCEHYWPMDYMPCLYGNLLVTIQSEQKESCWTRREFVLRNESTSEEQAVTHFHFTAWPDHGVPIRTVELIQFRWIVRKHIETFPFSGPTVVHCSAGVGRTGTLIALDMLLQQMDKEEVVNIAYCVHSMRLSRPLMVQTQSQYVFLHQCIMESLQPKEDSIPEPIYENSDMIYSNALALKEYKAANSGV